MAERRNPVQRLTDAVLHGPVTLRLWAVVCSVVFFFLVGYMSRGHYLDGFVCAAAAYAASVVAYVVLDISYRMNRPEAAFKRIVNGFLNRYAASQLRHGLMKEEIDLRLRTSHLVDILGGAAPEVGFPRTEIDELDEAMRVVGYVAAHLERDPTARAVISAVHVTKSQVDEEFNYWRSLKALDYLERQRNLMDLRDPKNRAVRRVEIRRYFITENEKLTVKALAVIAHHRYWEINTAWGVRNHPDCCLPLPGYENMMFVTVTGKTPFEVAIAVEPDAHPQAYGSRFATFWSFFSEANDGTQARLRQFVEGLARARAQLEEGSGIKLMDDANINAELRRLQVERKDPFAGGYLEFRAIRRRVSNVLEIKAVDLSSVKKSLSVLRQNPGFLEWQEQCFRQIESGRKNSKFHRCYLIDPDKHGTVDNFIEILLEYFRRLGNQEPLPEHVNIYYTSIHRVRKVIEELGQANFDVRLKSLSNLSVAFGSGIDQTGSDPFRGRLSVLHKLLVRDFICTEEFTYDYINPEADLDDTAQGEYKIWNRTDKNYAQIKREYEIIFEFLTTQCGAASVRTRKEVDKEIIAGVLGRGALLRQAAGSI
jgi:hypothetical protein